MNREKHLGGMSLRGAENIGARFASRRIRHENPTGFGLRQPSAAMVNGSASKSGRGLPQSKTLSRFGKSFGSHSLRIGTTRDPQGHTAFTLIELCVVLATVALFALMLLPLLAGTRPNTQATRCLNNLRQLAVAWSMYPGENNNSVMDCAMFVGSDSYMDWTTNPRNTNTSLLLTNNLMSGYVKSAALFKCPADKYQSAANLGPRARSVSLNGALGGSGPDAKGQGPDGHRLYYAKANPGPAVGNGARKMSQLNKPGPARTFLILDEHPDSINDGVFMHNPGWPRGQEQWRDLPASYHNGSAGISFVDGHTEMHKWEDKRTIQSVSMNGNRPPIWGVNLIVSKDYEWVQDGMPWREQ